MQIEHVVSRVKQIHGSVKALWGKLEDDEIPKIPRSRESLIEAVQAHFGYSREKAAAEIERRYFECR